MRHPRPRDPRIVAPDPFVDPQDRLDRLVAWFLVSINLAHLDPGTHLVTR